MAQPEAKRQKTKDGDESSDISRQDLVLRMSIKGMSLDAIADLLSMEPSEVARILARQETNTEDCESSDSGEATQGLGALVKRLMTDPKELCCPISHALIEHPVVAGDGFTYERSCIESCLKSKKVSPMTGKPIETTVLNRNQHVKSSILSFKEQTVAEIVKIAPQLPQNLAMKVLPRAESFVRTQPGALARRNLSTILLLKMRLPNEDRHAIIQEIASLLAQIQDDGQLQQFLCETDEVELLSLLPSMNEDTVLSLHNAMQASRQNCTGVIDKELISRLAKRFKEDGCLMKMWELLRANCTGDIDDCTQAAAVVLTAFIDRLDVDVSTLSSELLNQASVYLDQDEAITFAKDFFGNELGISTSPWPSKGSAKILTELAFRLFGDDDVLRDEKLQMLVKAYGIDSEDVSTRKSLRSQLHHCILHSETDLAGVDVEEVFLKLSLEDKEEISREVLAKLSLQDDQLAEFSADHLMSLAEQLSQADRCADAARFAVDAAKKLAKDDHEAESQDAYLKAYQWDRFNADASAGLVTTIMLMRKESQQLRAKCEELEGRCAQLETNQVPLMSFVWDLSGYDFSSFSKGDQQESDKFRITSGIKAKMSIYPKGRGKSSPGEAALMLSLDKSASLKVKATGGQAERSMEKFCSKNSQIGWSNFMNTSEVDGASITLHVLSVRISQSSVQMVARSS